MQEINEMEGCERRYGNRSRDIAKCCRNLICGSIGARTPPIGWRRDLGGGLAIAPVFPFDEIARSRVLAIAAAS